MSFVGSHGKYQVDKTKKKNYLKATPSREKQRQMTYIQYIHYK